MPYTTLRRSATAAPAKGFQHRQAAGWPAETERFADRSGAGRALGAVLAAQLGHSEADPPLVLGLPRGGAVIAREIARALDADLDVVVACKIGVPWQPTFGVAAIADDGPIVFDHGAIAGAGTTTTAIAQAARCHRLTIRRQQYRYRGERAAPCLKDRTVVIADDGMAPGIAARAAVRAVRAGGPGRIIYAAPVCAAESADLLRAEADAVVHLYSPRVFHALGLWYRDRSPVTDDDVAAILAMAWDERTTASVG